MRETGCGRDIISELASTTRRNEDSVRASSTTDTITPSSSRAWPGAGTNKPLEIVRGAIREAKLSASDVILVDTAGRLHIDDTLMEELGVLKRELTPAEILFVADAMIGQDAVRSAGEFHMRLGLSGATP